MDGWLDGRMAICDWGADESLVYQRTDRLVLGKFVLIDE